MRNIGDCLQLADVLEAMRCLAPVVHQTPMTESATFNALTGSHLHFKLENLQRTGSFKLRGSYNKISHLSLQQAAQGIVTASAGNHAQGVAFSAAEQKIKAKIFMPENTPKAKVQATSDYGAQVVLTGESYQESFEAALMDQQKTGATFIHAFDDYQVMAGQGTVAVEMLKQCPELQTVFVPIGGGGLAAGVATYLKNINRDIRVIGVQSECAPAVYNRYHQREDSIPEHISGIAEGILVKKPGQKTFPIIAQYLDDVVTVSDQEIAQAMILMLERSKLLVEGAGAAALAAVLSGRVPVRGKHAGLIISGGNTDSEQLPVLKQMALSNDAVL